MKKDNTDTSRSRVEASSNGPGDQSLSGHTESAPDPADVIPALDESQLSVLQQVGSEWGKICADPQVWRQTLPVDPDVGSYPAATDIRPTGVERFVRVSLQSGHSAEVEATSEADIPSSSLGRLGYDLKRIVIGPPLKSVAMAQERMRKLVALPVLSADAISSVAYGPEAMLVILVLAGSAGLAYTLPIAAVIAFMIVAVGISYRQTIRAYPHGGGSYIVASDNLGDVPGLTAAAGLLTDYILTVSVSVASGVAAVTSALPQLAPATVPIGVGVIAVLLLGNLRGIRQAGALFAGPTYAFIVAMVMLIIVGLVQAAGRGFHPTPLPPLTATEGVSVLLILRAFSSGSTAMTGIEAISNAVPAFQPVEWRNARTTLSWMVGILLALFIGTIALIQFDGVVPVANQTILSQLAHRAFGSGFLYIFTQAATAAILLLAADTAYNDFPRVLFLLARDRFAPRSFLLMGDRLAFTMGIIVLSVVAALIYVVFGGQTNPLIPLYAVGVFLAFTLSQTGMVVHWWHLRDAHWRRSLFFNAIGAVLSASVVLIAGITKFTDGAWVSLLMIGLLILVALRVRHHFTLAGKALALEAGTIEVPQRTFAPIAGAGGAPAATGAREQEEKEGDEETPAEIRHLLLVPIEAFNRASMRALAYAASLQQPVLALHLSPTDGEAERFGDYWRQWGDHLPLEIVISPYRALVAPMVSYIEALHRQHPDLTITVILPEIVVRHWWHRLLHNRVAPRLRRALRPLPRIVVTSVPFHLPG